MKMWVISMGAVVVLCGSIAQAGILADLEADYTEAGAVAGDPFTANNWSLADGAGNTLGYDLNLTDNTTGDGTVGDQTGYAGSDVIFGFIPDMPYLSDENVFNTASANPGELSFHPGDDGDNAQLVITWTADANYNDVGIDYSMRRGLAEDFFTSLTIGGTVGASLATTNTNADGSAITGTVLAGDVLAGQTIVITVAATGDGPGGDQSFGNFVIRDNIPEPASLALLGLGGLLIARRRRA